MAQTTVHVEALRAAEASLREPASASDEKSVVTIDIENLFVTRLVLARDWFQRGEVAGLVAACRTAYDAVSDAVKLRYFERIDQARERDENGTGSVREQSPRATGAVDAFRRSGPASAPAHSEVDELVARLTRDFDRLDQVCREQPPNQPRPPAPATTVVGTSENGQVRAVFALTEDDDSLTTLELDARWAQRQSPLQLGDMIKQAMNDGFTTMRSTPRQPNDHQLLAAQFGRTADAAAALSRRSGLR